MVNQIDFRGCCYEKLVLRDALQCVPIMAFGEGCPSPIVPRPSKTSSPALPAAPAALDEMISLIISAFSILLECIERSIQK